MTPFSLDSKTKSDSALQPRSCLVGHCLKRPEGSQHEGRDESWDRRGVNMKVVTRLGSPLYSSSSSSYLVVGSTTREPSFMTATVTAAIRKLGDMCGDCRWPVGGQAGWYATLVEAKLMCS